MLNSLIERNPYRGVMLIAIGALGFLWFGNESLNRYQIGSIIVGMAGAVMVGTHWLSKLGPFYAEQRRKRDVFFEVWENSLTPMEEALEHLERREDEHLPSYAHDSLQRSLQRVADHLSMAQVPHPEIGSISEVEHRIRWMNHCIALSLGVDGRTKKGTSKQGNRTIKALSAGASPLPCRPSNPRAIDNPWSPRPLGIPLCQPVRWGGDASRALA